MDTRTRPAHAVVKIHGTAEPIRFDNTGFAIERLMIAVLQELKQPQHKNRGGEIVIRISTDGPIREAEESADDKVMRELFESATYKPDPWEQAYIDLRDADPKIPEYKLILSPRGRADKSQVYIDSILKYIHATYTPDQLHRDATEWPTLN